MKNKYNLKKLIMENYLLSEKESKEFSEWVAKNLDYEITLSKDDFTTFLFNSNAETEIEFIEEILEKGSCCAGAMNDDIQHAMNLLAEITEFKSKEDLVEKIKELEMKINFLELQNESLLSRPEPIEKIIAAEKTITENKKMFNFLKNNKEFVRAVIKLKQSELNLTSKSFHEQTQNDINFIENESVFYEDDINTLYVPDEFFKLEDVKVSTVRLSKAIEERFNKFVADQKRYSKTSLLNLALVEFLEKYK